MVHGRSEDRRAKIMSEKIVQTAGRAQLGDFAPMFAHLNDDVLFGEVWNEDAIDVKTKCIIEDTSAEWLEPVSDEDYSRLK
jgi:alkylhydroperoxidase/carboxymuconolactone decarboxylase family protein YurZ